MTTPPVDPTGKRGKLTASSAALALAVAAALAAGILRVPAPPPPPVVTATGCAATLPGAIVVRFADATPSGVVSRGDIAPLVICGAQPIAYAMQTYVQWVAAGPCPCNNGGVIDTTTNPVGKVVLSPADTSATGFDPLVSMVVRSDSAHWTLPVAARVRWKLLGGMLYAVMGQSLVPGVKDPTPVPIIGWWSYVPVKGAMSRTQLSVNPVITGRDSVLNLTLTRSAPDTL